MDDQAENTAGHSPAPDPPPEDPGAGSGQAPGPHDAEPAPVHAEPLPVDAAGAVVIEDPVPAEQEGAETVEEADVVVEEDELTTARRERDEYLALAQRSRADFENFRKRASAEAKDAEVRGRTKVASALLPAIDNLERALLANGLDPAVAAEGEADDLGTGVLMVYRDLVSSLHSLGLEAYGPGDERFDPEHHEAITAIPAEGREAGEIVDVVAKGYRLDGRVVRAARVVVAR
ncbi:MAG: nucleotide exchange factor GrpE [Solirubrobacterales bacterium]